MQDSSKEQEHLYHSNDTPFLRSPPPDYDEAAAAAPVPEEHETRKLATLVQHPRRSDTRDAFRSDLANIALLPALNAAITIVLVAILIYVYTKADGQPVDYRLAGMQMPTLVSLIMTLVKMCLAGGIGYAVSEYKWVRMQHGARLSLVDVYDACTRGVGGIIRVITGISFDRVLVPTILLQLGLVAMGPASQQILTAYNVSSCSDTSPETSLRYTDLRSEIIANWQAQPYDMRGLAGTDTDSLINYAFDGASYNWGIITDAGCPPTATNCSYNAIEVPHLEFACNRGNFNTTTVVSDQDLSVKTLHDYYNASGTYGSYLSINVPRFLYAGSMQNRTRYHAFNYTASGPLTDSTDQSAYVGQPAFVALLYEGDTMSYGAIDTERISVLECTFNTYVNKSNYHVLRRDSKRDLLSSNPVQIDYKKFGDTSHWIHDNYSEEDRMALNFYALQLGIISVLAIPPGSDDSMKMSGSFDEFSAKFLSLAGPTMTLGRPFSKTVMNGYVCYNHPRSYHVSPAAYYSVSLVLLIPLLWWFLTWFVSLRLNGGISRGQSQVALMVTGLSSAVREQFRGFSHTDQNVLFSRSRQVHVVFGEIPSEDGRKGHAAFGLKNQVAPIKRRKTTPVLQKD